MATKTMNFTSKGIIGDLLVMMEELLGVNWATLISLYVDSNEETEHYSWFGNVPLMRTKGEGGHLAKTLRQFDHSITNVIYEASIIVLLEWIRRDKTGQIEAKIAELARTPGDHWRRLLVTLIENGESTACYDGQFFFDTDHSEGDSGTQSNDISVDISAIPAQVSGSTTAPSPEEMRGAIFKTLTQLFSLKDDQGRHINQDARAFDVLLPLAFWEPAHIALNGALESGGGSNVSLSNLQVGNESVSIALHPVPNLTWTTKFATFIRGGQALIRQEEVPPYPKAKAEGSDFEYDNDAWEFAMQSTRAAGYGRWQHACLATLT